MATDTGSDTGTEASGKLNSSHMSITGSATMTKRKQRETDKMLRESVRPLTPQEVRCQAVSWVMGRKVPGTRPVERRSSPT